ncbi:MAG: superinfection immunity protein [Betaproteobacteria bacterium]|nr:superinfection immunity protein [Betaproteobacteria bacterium]
MASKVGKYDRFLPTLIAITPKHHNAMTIFLLNLFPEWSVIGWVAALVWSFTRPPPERLSIILLLPQRVHRHRKEPTTRAQAEMRPMA